MQNMPLSIAFTLILCAVFLDIRLRSFYNSICDFFVRPKEFLNMKKLLSALLCALLIGSCACAETPVFPTPTPDVSAQPSAAPENQSAAGGMDFTFNQKSIRLDFDPDPEYSICKDGYVQASFYTTDTDGLLYELYVTFPQTVQSGETITPENSIEDTSIASGLVLFVSDDYGMDVCSAATQYLTGPYPEGSSYSINFSSVTANGSEYTFEGTLTGNLVEVDENFYATDTINECSGAFRFTMDLGSAEAPNKDRSEPAPSATPIPELPATPSPESDASPAPESDATPAPKQKRPPVAPAKLTTPADAKKI